MSELWAEHAVQRSQGNGGFVLNSDIQIQMKIDFNQTNQTHTDINLAL